MQAARSAWLADPDVPPAEKDLLRKVSLAVHGRDAMYERGRGRHYLGVGLSALRCIEQFAADRPAPKDILDFASGYGRVLRLLTVRFPQARVVASDVDRAALHFCERTLGATALESGTDLAGLDLGRRFDLIWCGSLITHLSEPLAVDLLDFFARHLQPDGLCLASAHGDVTIEALRSGRNRYGLTEGAAQTVLDSFDRTGFGYADYQGMTGYGISIASRSKVEAMLATARLDLVRLLERGWDDHHDVYGLVASGAVG
jgi:SAM-dependent methyltransferase